MNRKEFMVRLEQLLAGVSEEERTDALQYYEDYFDDAGTENEQNVIEELETPEKVAAIIRMNLSEGSEENGEFTEQGYKDARFDDREIPAMREGQKKSGAYGYHSERDNTSYAIPPKINRLLKVILVALIVLIVCPVTIPIAIGLIATVFALFVASFAIFASFVIAAVAIAASGLVLVVLGIVRLAVMFPSAVLTVGIGMLMFTVGMIGTVATVKLCIVMYPAIFRIIVKIFRWPFHRRAVA